jgi:zona occludens toxin (predicted ATPase)
MIEVFEGRLGGGKTYSAVSRMVAHLAAGGVVCTNVDLLWPGIVKLVADRWGFELEDSQLIRLEDHQVYEFHKYTPSGTPDLPVLVVLDEAHIHFNARDYATTDKNYRETLIFLTQSRKVSTDVIFISQSIFNIDSQFARLVQYIWRFRDLAKWKIPGLGIGCPFKGILAVQFDYDGKTVLQREFVPKDKAIFSCYETNSLLRGFPRLEGVTTKRKLKRVQRSQSLLVPSVLLVLLDVLMIAALLVL